MVKACEREGKGAGLLRNICYGPKHLCRSLQFSMSTGSFPDLKRKVSLTHHSRQVFLHTVS